MNDALSQVHREIWQLIPWLVNDSASADERARGERHLRECADCRDEFAMQLRIRSALDDGPATADDAHSAFARLLTRIDAESALPAAAEAQRPAARSATLGERWLPGLLAAVVVQAIGLVALAAFAMQQSQPLAPQSGPSAAPYATLSRASPVPSAAVIRLVPATDLTLGALQAMLVEHGLRIVDASADGAILGLAPTRSLDVAATVVRLRARADVLLAEPIRAPNDAR